MKESISRFRDRQSRDVLELRGMIRRLRVTLSDAEGLWQMLGYEDPDGNKEIFDKVENFSGIGFYSRPAKGSKAECVVVNIGGQAGHPVIVATRDKSVQVELSEDETAIFTSKGLVKITSDGVVELGAAGLGTSDGMVHGSGIDPFTGKPYWMLGATSDIVRGKK